MSLLDYLRKPYIMIPIAAAGAAMAIAGAKKAAPTIDDVIAKVVPDVSVERLVGDGVAWAGENDPIEGYFDIIKNKLKDRRSKHTLTKSKFIAAYEMFPELQEIIPNNVFNTLTDGKGDEAYVVSLTMDRKYLTVAMQTERNKLPDGSTPGYHSKLGKYYFAQKSLTPEQAASFIRAHDWARDNT